MAVMRRNRVGRRGLKKWDKVKIPWYTHRLMHRKRMTCELHDSYFRLMTIKHTIPKIEWAIELLYNSVWTGTQSWSQDELETICGRENSTQQKAGAPGPRLSSPGEQQRHTAMSGGNGKVNMLQSLFSLELPLTHNLSNKVRGIFF